MTNPMVSLLAFVSLSCAPLLVVLPVRAQDVPTLLQVDVENLVFYLNDVADPAKLAKISSPVSPAALANFYSNMAIADVTMLNGNPAMGVMVMQIQVVALSPAPSAGGAIADLTRGSCVTFRFEFLTPDGTSFGSVFAVGLAGGTAVPGSPIGSTSGNNAVVGGTGAYQGARGTLNNVSMTGTRSASQAEDPFMRRTNGGGKGRFIIQIWPMFRPEIVVTPDGPAVMHDDFSPVTAARPARRGETLMLYARNLGPTRPAVNYGDPFPVEPVAVITSPVTVLVDSKGSPAINQLGVPGTTDTYRIDFRVPDEVAAGTVALQVSAAWIRGAAVRIPVQ